MVKAIVQKGVRLTIQHVPHLSLAVLVLIFQCVLIEGVYLDGQIVLCIDEFCQNRELFKFCAISAQCFRVGGRIISQGGAVGQVAGAVRVAGEHPGFGQRVQVALHAKIGAQTAAAPQVVFAAGGQFDDCHKQVAPFLIEDLCGHLAVVPPQGQAQGVQYKAGAAIKAASGAVKLLPGASVQAKW